MSQMKRQSLAADLLDRHVVEVEGGGNTSGWKSEVRELMAAFRKEKVSRSARITQDRAARSAEVRELMDENRAWLAEARADWQEEAESRREDVQWFLEDLRRERRAE